MGWVMNIQSYKTYEDYFDLVTKAGEELDRTTMIFEQKNMDRPFEEENNDLFFLNENKIEDLNVVFCTTFRDVVIAGVEYNKTYLSFLKLHYDFLIEIKKTNLIEQDEIDKILKIFEKNFDSYYKQYEILNSVQNAYKIACNEYINRGAMGVDGATALSRISRMSEQTETDLDKHLDQMQKIRFDMQPFLLLTIAYADMCGMDTSDYKRKVKELDIKSKNSDMWEDDAINEKNEE